MALAEWDSWLFRKMHTTASLWACHRVGLAARPSWQAYMASACCKLGGLRQCAMSLSGRARGTLGLCREPMLRVPRAQAVGLAAHLDCVASPCLGAASPSGRAHSTLGLCCEPMLRVSNAASPSRLAAVCRKLSAFNCREPMRPIKGLATVCCELAAHCRRLCTTISLTSSSDFFSTTGVVITAYRELSLF